ncbi:TetR/AcrR family transcriptional regulator [Pseudonocardia sp. C8]|uniref:TetR/AcrR family transcriptional regulator n=1 Tax=Pseudonocardia sp. C8 TaxID=2762759 RepID=UPI001642687D|nr:TetR/AcrR family transcriptional regulator [Pseudonocardia sp. C8]MBC3194877.1 TetR/AcrR family transcriptional regulator [Pseudonocardia sp. C8]
MRHGSAVQDRILDTAARLFYAHGVRAVGVDRVIAEAGVAKASLYAHFGSKNELVVAYLRRQADLVHQGLRHVEGEAETGPARVAALFDHAAAACGQPGYQGCHFLNAAAEHLDPDSGAAEVLAEHRAFVLAYLERNVQGSTRAERAEVARIILTLYDGAKVASMDEGSAAFARVKPVAVSMAGE